MRRDLRLQSSQGHILECSHFTPCQRLGPKLRKVPVVVYLHGNSSSRLEAWNIVEAFLEQGISLFCYDAAGCGKSGGEYVSLGWHERNDLAVVLAHLRTSPFCGPVGIYGRSMGAVTALMYAHMDPSLGAMLVDSPFWSLRVLIEELAQGTVTLPTWLLESLIQMIRGRVQTLAGFDIEDIVPNDYMDKTYVPTLFVHGQNDHFITPSHSRKLFENFAGDKEHLLIDGDHNTTRSDEAVAAFVGFFCRAFRHHEIDLSVPAEIVDAQLAVPALDGLPRRVPGPVVPPDVGARREPITPPARAPPETPRTEGPRRAGPVVPDMRADLTRSLPVCGPPEPSLGPRRLGAGPGRAARDDSEPSGRPRRHSASRAQKPRSDEAHEIHVGRRASLGGA